MEDEILVALIVTVIICCAALITLNYVIALKFEAIAFDKGYGASIHSFAMCFFLGIIGYLYVIALPNLHANRDSDVKEEQ